MIQFSDHREATPQEKADAIRLRRQADAYRSAKALLATGARSVTVTVDRRNPDGTLTVLATATATR
jgi:hypothetical protein